MVVFLGVCVFFQIGARPGVVRCRNHDPGIQVGNPLGAVFIRKGLPADAGVVGLGPRFGTGGRRTGNQCARMGMTGGCLSHVAAGGAVVVILLRGGLCIPGVGLPRVLCAADSADMVVFLGVCVFFQIGDRPGVVRCRNHDPAIQICDGLGAVRVLKILVADAALVVVFRAVCGTGGRRTGNQNPLMGMGQFPLIAAEIAGIILSVVVHMGRHVALARSAGGALVPVVRLVIAPAIENVLVSGSVLQIAVERLIGQGGDVCLRLEGGTRNLRKSLPAVGQNTDLLACRRIYGAGNAVETRFDCRIAPGEDFSAGDGRDGFNSVPAIRRILSRCGQLAALDEQPQGQTADTESDIGCAGVTYLIAAACCGNIGRILYRNRGRGEHSGASAAPFELGDVDIPGHGDISAGGFHRHLAAEGQRALCRDSDAGGGVPARSRQGAGAGEGETALAVNADACGGAVRCIHIRTGYLVCSLQHDGEVRFVENAVAAAVAAHSALDGGVPQGQRAGGAVPLDVPGTSLRVARLVGHLAAFIRGGVTDLTVGERLIAHGDAGCFPEGQVHRDVPLRLEDYVSRIRVHIEIYSILAFTGNLNIICALQNVSRLCQREEEDGTAKFLRCVGPAGTQRYPRQLGHVLRILHIAGDFHNLTAAALRRVDVHRDDGQRFFLPAGIERGVRGKDRFRGHQIAAGLGRVPAQEDIVLPGGRGQSGELAVLRFGAGGVHRAAVGVKGDGVPADIAAGIAGAVLIVRIIVLRLLRCLTHTAGPAVIGRVDRFIVGPFVPLRGDHFPVIQILDFFGALRILKGLAADGADIVVPDARLSTGGRCTWDPLALVDMGHGDGGSAGFGGVLRGGGFDGQSSGRLVCRHGKQAVLRNGSAGIGTAGHGPRHVLTYRTAGFPIRAFHFGGELLHFTHGDGCGFRCDGDAGDRRDCRLAVEVFLF